MVRCNCGCNEFSATEKQTWTVSLTFNSNRDIEYDNNEELETAEFPEGPFVCVNCGKKYESIEDIPDDGLADAF